MDALPTLVSQITADLDAEVTAWRPLWLDPGWPIAHPDRIIVHVRGKGGRLARRTLSVAMGSTARPSRPRRSR